ncbi:MAG: sugar kinase [Prevotella sp.]|nr:sugar kinase [Prevotella sp.]
MTDNKRIVTFGELLLRFSKSAHRRFTQREELLGNFGGSEANVAISLATLGDNVDYVTRLPNTQIGLAAKMMLQQYQLGVDHLMMDGDRMGAYYFEGAASLRNSSVTYDRANSAFAQLKPGMIDWHEVLRGASVFHTSGIAAALNQDAADTTFEALQVADEMGITISFDINHRKNLWRYPGAQPVETLSRMLEYADVMFGDVIEFEFLTGHPKIPFKAIDTSYKMDLEPYREWFQNIVKRFPRCKKWLMGMRNQVNASHHLLTALMWSEGKLYHTRIYDIADMVDPMGVGDAFAAGQIHAMLAYPDDNQRILDYALATSTLKYTFEGDACLATDDEIQWLMRT